MNAVALVNLDDVCGRITRGALQSAGFTVAVACGRDAAVAAVNRPCAVVIANCDGHYDETIALLSYLRGRAGRRTSVIVLASDPDENTRVELLEAGADDVMTKPPHVGELLARLGAILRRSSPGLSEAYEYADETLEVSIGSMRVRHHGHEYGLSVGEAAVLALLIGRAPAFVTVAQICDELDTGEDLKPGTIEGRLKSIRRKVGAEYIESRQRYGYAFRAPSDVLRCSGGERG